MPKINFTARKIDSLKALPTKREEYWDDSVPGFGLRISIEGRKSWVFMYRFNGRLRRYTIGTYPSLSLADARQKALEAKYAVSHGKDPGLNKQIERKAELFGELITEYIEKHAKPKKKSWEEDQRILNREFLPSWRNLKAKDITRREVILVLDKIMERGSPILANKALAVVRKLFNFAIQRDLVSINPCWNIPTPAKERTRDRVLNEEELKALWSAIEKENLITASFYKLLILTAQRSGELSLAEWAEIDFIGGWWTIPAEKAKNGLPHRIPLCGLSLKIFKMLRLSCGGPPWVFPSTKGNWPIKERKRCLKRLIQNSSVKFRPHDLRRTAASHMTSIGISRLTVAKLLNHKDKGVTAIYDRHSYDSEKIYALNKWEYHLTELVVQRLNIVKSYS